MDSVHIPPEPKTIHPFILLARFKGIPNLIHLKSTPPPTLQLQLSHRNSILQSLCFSGKSTWRGSRYEFPPTFHHQDSLSILPQYGSRIPHSNPQPAPPPTGPSVCVSASCCPLNPAAARVPLKWKSQRCLALRIRVIHTLSSLLLSPWNTQQCKFTVSCKGYLKCPTQRFFPF